MAKSIAKPEKCQGCTYCIVTCPKKAISQTDQLNGKGARPIVVDQEKCVGCGACYVVCPDYVFTITD